jgi:glutamate synthase domain-containing protein 2
MIIKNKKSTLLQVNRVKLWNGLTNWSKTIGLSTVTAVSLLASYLGAKQVARTVVKRTMNKATYRLMTDPYAENLWEFVHSANRVNPQVIVETNLRAEEGVLLKRPLGSAKKFPDFSNLMFDMAQLRKFATPDVVDVDTKVILGPQANKPLVINMPIMISAMAYGLAISAKGKIALAKGAAKVGTVTNSGEGAFLQAERDAASKFIIQYPRGNWNKDEKILKQADMIEIQVGQGASAGTGHITKSKDISFAIKRKLGLFPGQDAFIPARVTGVHQPKDFKKLVIYLRELTGGVPIGIKFGAGKYLEEDIAVAIEAGVDAVVIDGAQAATVGAAPILEDDFGLPTLIAICRAGRYFQEQGLKGKVSLIISGGLYVPGDFLKAIALGADAVYIGTIALFAMSHTQSLKAMPFEPPTQIVWATGHFKKQFKVEKAATTLAKFLTSCNLEIKEGIKALGKTALSQVSKDDLVALDPQTAAIAQVDLAYEI